MRRIRFARHGADIFRSTGLYEAGDPSVRGPVGAL